MTRVAKIFERLTWPKLKTPRFLEPPAPRLAIWSILLIAALVGLGRGWGTTPAFGPLLSPFQGLWIRAKSPFEPSAERKKLSIKGLKARVEVLVDKDQVKHVFAENDDDLYFTQGFLVASDRLWEMEFLARLAAGRLAEVAGRKALEMDKFFVKSGIPEAAKEAAELMLQDAVSGPALRAYTDGVNAFIRSLNPKRLPFEYRILGYQPEEWTPLKAALIGKFMAFYLSGLSTDLPLTRSRWLLHKIEFDDLFPIAPTISDPIVPKGTPWAFSAPEMKISEREFKPDIKALAPLPQPDPGSGSNNWAVSGRKSSTGYPILSNDIHLGLQLPSLWHQIQLVSPNQNVMGVSLVGVPGVMLGFNARLAWGVTNGYNDILDWYQMRFRDERQSEYLFDREWRPVISRETEIKVRGESPVKLTLRRTHFGPVVYDPSEDPLRKSVPRGLAMRWAALEASNELKSFLLLNRGKSIQDCRRAIEQFHTPDQNFLCADSSGGIGIWHMGRYPIKSPGQGRMILDGSTDEDDWHGWIPRDHAPQAKNPARGFLSSANQWPVDGRYPYYLGSAFMPAFRAMRINELLSAKAKHSPEDIMRMQGDSLSIPARMLVPVLLKQIASENLDKVAKRAYETLGSWDFKYEESSVGASIFNRWFHHLNRRLWSERFPGNGEHAYPSLERTIELITMQPNSKWFDDPKTEGKESLREVARDAFADTVTELRDRHGKNVEKWTWARHNPTFFKHMTSVQGLGRKLSARGHAQGIFANTGDHGPAWKLVVALGPKTQAWGVYPGGQAGDPTSPYYDTYLGDWARNELKPLAFLQAAKDSYPQFKAKFELNAEGEPK